VFKSVSVCLICLVHKTESVNQTPCEMVAFYRVILRIDTHQILTKSLQNFCVSVRQLSLPSLCGR